MARSSIVDPLEKFRFRLSWSVGEGSEATDLVRVGFHDVQMPKKTVNKIEYREGIDPDINQLSAGLVSMEDIILNRGLIANDQNNELYKWMSAVQNPTAGHVARAGLKQRSSNSASNEYKKDVTIEMLDREGGVAAQWTLYNAFPVGFVPGSDLDASEDGDKSLEQLTLAYEDFKQEDPSSNKSVDVSSSIPA